MIRAWTTGKWEYYIGGYKFRVDQDLGDMADLHVWQNGKEIVSRFVDGTQHHGRAAGEITKDMIKTLLGAARSGCSKAKALLTAFRDGQFGADIDMVADALKGHGLAIMAITSLDAYFQINPEDFIDICRTIGMYGPRD